MLAGGSLSPALAGERLGEGAPLCKAPVIPGFEWASSNRLRWGWRRRPGQKIGPQFKAAIFPFRDTPRIKREIWPPVRSRVPRQTAAGLAGVCRGAAKVWPGRARRGSRGFFSATI